MKIISYYTKNTGYEKEVQCLIKSAKKHHYQPYIEGIESFGSWNLNTKYKPFLVLRAMDKFPNEDYFLFLDADAIIHKKIPLDIITGDISVCHTPIESQKQEGWLLSGSIFIKNNNKMKKIMHEWIDINKKNPTIFDQDTLYTVLKNNFENLEIQRLPLKYCKVNGSKKSYHKRINDPIISQNQASRKFKKKVRNGKGKKNWTKLNSK